MLAVAILVFVFFLFLRLLFLLVLVFFKNVGELDHWGVAGGVSLEFFFLSKDDEGGRSAGSESLGSTKQRRTKNEERREGI